MWLYIIVYSGVNDIVVSMSWDDIDIILKAWHNVNIIIYSDDIVHSDYRVHFALIGDVLRLYFTQLDVYCQKHVLSSSSLIIWYTNFTKLNIWIE